MLFEFFCIKEILIGDEVGRNEPYYGKVSAGMKNSYQVERHRLFTADSYAEAMAEAQEIAESEGADAWNLTDVEDDKLVTTEGGWKYV